MQRVCLGTARSSVHAKANGWKVRPEEFAEFRVWAALGVRLRRAQEPWKVLELWKGIIRAGLQAD